ncbi:MAG: sugar transferase [Bacteroidales bacterium]|nr:sugar transferase [Bacteroidales bacterium]
MKRIFDIFCSFLGLLALSLLFLIVALLVATTSRGAVFYRQVRWGRISVMNIRN